MLCNIRRRAHQSLIAHLTDLNDIICHKTVSSLNQFKGCLALSDPALSHDQHANAVHIHKHAVDGNTGRQPYVHPTDDLRGKIGCLLCRLIYRHSMSCCHFQEFILRLHITAEYNTGDRMFQKPVINVLPAFICKSMHISILHMSDNLHPVRVKMIEEPGKLQRRAVNIRHMHLGLGHIYLGSEILQIHSLNNFA